MKHDLQYSLPEKPTVNTLNTVTGTLDGLLMTIKLAENVPDVQEETLFAYWTCALSMLSGS